MENAQGQFIGDDELVVDTKEDDIAKKTKALLDLMNGGGLDDFLKKYDSATLGEAVTDSWMAAEYFITNFGDFQGFGLLDSELDEALLKAVEHETGGSAFIAYYKQLFINRNEEVLSRALEIVLKRDAVLAISFISNLQVYAHLGGKTLKSLLDIAVSKNGKTGALFFKKLSEDVEFRDLVNESLN